MGLRHLLRRPPQTSQAEAAAGLERGVTVYWRPGCTFCQRLRASLGELGRRATWVDIWSDDDARAFVRTTNDGGFETVPTVVIDGVPHTNPPPRVVRQALTRR